MPLKGRDTSQNLRRLHPMDATDFFSSRGYTGASEGQGGAAVLIYLDLVMLLNFFVDFMLLLGTNRLSGFPPEWKRLLLAAALGGGYSGVCLLPAFRFLGNTLWRMVSLAGMCVIAFGYDRSALKRCGVFLLLAMALGGAAVCFNSNDLTGLLLCAGGLWLLCRVAFGDAVGEREYLPLEINYNGRCVTLTALRDSGNTLRDPITGEQVLVIGPDAAQTLTGLTPKQLSVPLETLAAKPMSGLRLIPYRAVGQGSAMLLAMRFQNVKIGPRRQSAIVAFAPEGLGRGELYQALAGGGI